MNFGSERNVHYDSARYEVFAGLQGARLIEASDRLCVPLAGFVLARKRATDGLNCCAQSGPEVPFRCTTGRFTKSHAFATLASIPRNSGLSGRDRFLVP